MRFWCQAAAATAAWVFACAIAAEVAIDPAIVEGKQWAEGARRYCNELRALATASDEPDVKALARVYCQHAICDLFDKARRVTQPSEDDPRDVHAWFLAHPTLAGTLALALEPQDNPDGVLEVLRALMPTRKDATLRAPDFYVAFAVVWDTDCQPTRATAQPYVPGGRLATTRPAAPRWGIRLTDTRPGEPRVRDAFAHYVRFANRMRVDLTALPWQLARFVVDSKLPPSERQWALHHYDRRKNYGALYGDVRYDIEHSRWKPGSRYTLENIRRYGGVCGDQAYFASQTAKACGCPSIPIAGPTASGIGHAWVMILWGTDTGRFRWSVHGGEDDTRASYTDPQTGQRHSLRDAHLLARTMSLSAIHRTSAAVYFRTASLLREDLEPAQTLGLLKLAAKANPYDTRSWLLLSEMMARQETGTAEKAAALYRFLLDKFRKDPEFTSNILLSLMPLIPDDDVARRCRVYEVTCKIYRKQPDIVAELGIQLAQSLAARGHDRQAAAIYRDLIKDHRANAHLILPALDGAEAIYRKHRAIGQVVEMYEQVYLMYSKKKDEALFYSRAGFSGFYYTFAQKLLALYRETGNARKADEMQRRMARIDRERLKAMQRGVRRGQR